MLVTEAIEINIGRNGVDCPTTEGFLRSLRLKGEFLLGMALGLDDERTRLLKLAGLLHDIGKLAVPNAILKKPGPLTSAEWEQIHMHSEIGASALTGLKGFEEIQSAVLCHHENNDGTGYPCGLMGDDIPVFAKLIKVADIFTATSSERSYKTCFSRRYAITAALKEVSFSEGATKTITNVLQVVRITKQ
jgi:HD-GYP domain-containing protein (c-di-GMP phosphodiesterase class II)